jgi:hypothetical protein
VERGNFNALHYHRRELRMTFDVSPYPTLEGLNRERTYGPSPEEVHEMLTGARAFYAGDVSAQAKGERATEDDVLWGYQTSKCVVL